jgi:hypothetical protein
VKPPVLTNLREILDQALVNKASSEAIMEIASPNLTSQKVYDLKLLGNIVTEVSESY